MLVVEAGLFWVSVEETLKPSWIWTYTQERLVPLTHVHAEAVLVETTSEVKITQKYINRQSFPIEAIYVFPLDEHAAVCEFEAEIQGKKVTGIVKPKEQAQIEYNQAIRRGDGAYLLEQAKPDIFRAKVGNIPPGVEVSITIKYVAEMKNELEKVRFLLPTYVAPRYTPAYTPANQVAPSTGTIGPNYFTPYQLSVNVTAVTAAAGGFSAIESPSHPITTTITGNVASIGLDRGVTDLTKDFLLMVTYANPHEPKVVLEEDGKGSYAAMVTLFPHLEFNDSKTELIFVVDRSGSMESKVKELREALQLFMRSLPEGCYFNIVGFGSSFTKLFPTSRLYNDETLNLATKHISTLNADLGGTELYQPLNDVLKGKGIPGYSRQVFVLTDGQISNTEQVIALVQQNNKQSRLFALGIGDSVSHHLVEGLARAGKGTSFFVMENERMEKKIMKQLKDATQPALNDVKVNWGVNTGKPAGGEAVGSKVLSLLNYVSPTVTEKPSVLHQAPFNVPPIFSDNHFRVYSIFETSKLPEKVVIEAMSPDGLLRVELPVDAGKIIKGNLIHTLSARAMIRDLEEGSSYLHTKGASPSAVNVRDEVIRLGTKYSLASKHTSFLAIEERSPQEKWFNCYAPPPVPVPVPVPSAVPIPRRSVMAMSKSAAAPPPPSAYNQSYNAAPPPPPASFLSFSAAPPSPLGGGPAKERKKMASKSMKGSRGSHFDAEFATESAVAMDEDEEASDDHFAGFTYAPTAPSMSASMPQQQAQARNNASDPYTLMGNLLALQNTQGAFTYSAQFASAVGLSLSAIVPPLSSLSALTQIQDNGVRERVWATVLALIFLKNKLGSLSDEWELVDKKARKWLASQGVAQLDDIFAAASGLIH